MQDSTEHLESLATRPLIQVPGPNPIVRRGKEREWDGRCIEGGDIFKDYHEGQEVYYLYYHGVGNDKDRWPGIYRIGVAIATQPLGPFDKVPQNPILDLGPKGSWDDINVACPCIMKQGPGKYIMWYWGSGTPQKSGGGCVGLATAPHPLGPWHKYEGNPLIKDFGYLGSVVLVNGKYYMYNEYPIGCTAPDYGPLCVATATDPYGPWEPWESNPVLAPTGWGAWDDGGYSEAKVVHREGLFHVFYGGAKQHPTRMRTLESIGYAFSHDGYHFRKHLHNPVALHERNPGASAFAEVQCLFEPPLIYLYHTLRYLASEDPGAEDLGVQVLATSVPFKINMPVLRTSALLAGTMSELALCPPMSLDHVRTLALTVRCAYDRDASAPLRVHVRASDDGLTYDTADWHVFDIEVSPGHTAQKTVDVSASPRFVKVLLENLDPRCSARDLAATATIGG